jgi:hypothetical protein
LFAKSRQSASSTNRNASSDKSNCHTQINAED